MLRLHLISLRPDRHLMRKSCLDKHYQPRSSDKNKPKLINQHKSRHFETSWFQWSQAIIHQASLEVRKKFATSFFLSRFFLLSSTVRNKEQFYADSMFITYERWDKKKSHHIMRSILAAQSMLRQSTSHWRSFRQERKT